jgi:hypothetical protein
MALRPLAMADELRLRPLPGLGIDKRRHPDGNPFALRASRTTLAMARMAICEPAQPIGAPDLPRRRPMVIGFPLIEGVSPHRQHTTWRPPLSGSLPRRDPLCRKAPRKGVGTSRRLHAPAIARPHTLRFGLVNHERRRSGGRLADVRVALGRIPPVDPALASRSGVVTSTTSKAPSAARSRHRSRAGRSRRVPRMPSSMHTCPGSTASP